MVMPWNNFLFTLNISSALNPLSVASDPTDLAGME